MRIRVLQKPSVAQIDGIDLRRFGAGKMYDVGNRIGALMLAEGWAEPVSDDEPALLIPFSDVDPFTSSVRDAGTPPNLIRETYPPYADGLAVASNLERRRRSRHRRK